MTDRLLDLINQIQDCETELEELEECGCLEERMDCALRLEELKATHFKAKMEETGERE